MMKKEVFYNQKVPQNLPLRNKRSLQQQLMHQILSELHWLKKLWNSTRIKAPLMALDNNSNNNNNYNNLKPKRVIKMLLANKKTLIMKKFRSMMI